MWLTLPLLLFSWSLESSLGSMGTAKCVLCCVELNANTLSLWFIFLALLGWKGFSSELVWSCSSSRFFMFARLENILHMLRVSLAVKSLVNGCLVREEAHSDGFCRACMSCKRKETGRRSLSAWTEKPVTSLVYAGAKAGVVTSITAFCVYLGKRPP